MPTPRIVSGVVAALLLSGCITLGPDYEAPEVIVADDWHQQLVGTMATDGTTSEWWRSLEDGQLTDLIARAQRRNLDIRIAVARIDEASRFVDAARGGRWPDADATGSYQQVREFDEISDVAVGATWELDFWGRVRRSVESAQASYEGTVESYRDVLVILNAEVASQYVGLRTLQERVRLAEANVDRQRDTLNLVAARHRAELAPELELQQARAGLAATEAAVPALRQQLLQTINVLSALLGEQPGALGQELETVAPIPDPPDNIAAGIPADTIRNRPDVRSAERALAAQTARIGIATTALYPNFFLNGSFGYAAIDDDLFDSDNKIWSVGPFFSWNLFDGGRVQARIAIEEARTEQALLIYEAAVLEALRDADNALIAYGTERERLAALDRSVAAAAASADLVTILYRSGLTDFQNVLDTERALFSQQDLYATSLGQVVQNVITVYRAVGGGWSSTAPIPVMEKTSR